MILKHEVINHHVFVHVDTEWTPSRFKQACAEWDELTEIFKAKYFFVYIPKSRRAAAERWGFKVIRYINTSYETLALLSRPTRDIRKTRKIC